MCDGTYGGGVATWERLAAAKLERLDVQVRRAISDALGLLGGSAGRGVDGSAAVPSQRSLSHFGNSSLRPSVGVAVGSSAFGMSEENRLRYPLFFLDPPPATIWAV